MCRLSCRLSVGACSQLYSKYCAPELSQVDSRLSKFTVEEVCNSKVANYGLPPVHVIKEEDMSTSFAFVLATVRNMFPIRHHGKYEL